MSLYNLKRGELTIAEPDSLADARAALARALSAEGAQPGSDAMTIAAILEPGDELQFGAATFWIERF